MQELIAYFNAIPSSHRALIIVSGLCFFWLVEAGLPLFKFRYKKWQHAAFNLFFTATTVVVNVCFAYLIFLTSEYTYTNGVGLLHIVPLPLWASLLVGLLVLDLVGAYLVHLTEHKVKFMWRFHMVHHADEQVDTTTANRHHPGESIFRAVFTLAAVAILGAPMWLVMLYQSLSVVLSQFNHANINLPEKLDSIIRWVLVSPNMHKVHHHYLRPETDTNYGNIFSVWDRLFGTYYYVPMQQLQYGLDVLEGQPSQNLVEQLKLPFNKAIKTDD